jgi:hypothetical protein
MVWEKRFGFSQPNTQISRVVYHFDTGSLAGIGIDIPYTGTGWLVFWLVF